MNKFLLFPMLVLILGVRHAYAANLCPNPIIQTITASGSTQLAPAPTGNNTAIHVCMVQIQVTQGSTAANFRLTAGTGTACAVNTVSITPTWVGVANASQFYNFQPGASITMDLPVNTALCLNLSAVPTSAIIYVLYTTSL